MSTNNALLDTAIEAAGAFGRWFRKGDKPELPKTKTYRQLVEINGKKHWPPMDKGNDSVYNITLNHEKSEINYWQEELNNCVFGTEDYENISRRLKALKQPNVQNKVLAHIHKEARNLGKLRPGATYRGEIDTHGTLWIDYQQMLHNFPEGSYTVTGKN